MNTAYGVLRSTAVWLTLAVVAIATGCSHRGDFSAFLVQEVVKYGGRIDTSAVLPKVEASWTVKASNTNGFTVYVTGARWEDIDALMRAALGKRARSSPERVYGEASTGVGVTLHWIFIKGRTEVECMRGEMP